MLHAPKVDGKPLSVLRAMLTTQQKRLERAVKFEEERGIVFPETTVIGKDVQKLAAQIQKLEGAQREGTHGVPCGLTVAAPELGAPASAPSTAPSAPAGPSVRSRAAVALERSCASQVEIAVRLGVSQPAVAQWTSGATVPREEHRQRLAECYGIEVAWWDEPASEASVGAPVSASMPPPSEPVDDPELGDGPTAARDAAAAMVRRLRGYRIEAVARNDMAAVVKLAELERRALADFAKVNGELTPADEARLTQTPRFRAIVTAVSRALARFPDAARAVAAMLREFDGSLA